MNKISAVIITYNEEKYIARCISSLEPVADEIIVLDSCSTDRTPEICRKMNVRFFSKEFSGYRDQKNDAISLASHQYILALDADEALSPALQTSILKAKSAWRYDAYRFNRLNCYCRQWIKHSGWYPERKIRLFDRSKGRWGGYNIHETISMERGASIGYLKGDLLHWIHDSYEEHVSKINRYSSIHAEEMFRAGFQASFLTAELHFIWRFFRMFFLRLGFLDGLNGLMVTSIESFSSFLKYAKLRQICRREKKGSQAV
jgi:glycosyltransferase involved in cell wall biosynthesis